MKTMKLCIKKLKENAIIPQRATSGSAGYDLCACIPEKITIKKGDIIKIPTGISVALDSENYAVMVYARSGLASKNGITLANCVGVVDSDYRGEIIIPLINLGKDDFVIEPSQRIAQMVIKPIAIPEICVCETLSETERGKNGFGSTGI